MTLKVGTRMRQNPFKKRDKGCCFICVVVLFVLTQAVFYSSVLAPAFFNDHSIALQDEEEVGKLRSELVDAERMIIPVSLYYVFSLLALISYLRLIFTDITFINKPPPGVPQEELEGKICPICKTLYGQFLQAEDEDQKRLFLRRDDIIHCYSCNTCCEFYDHHCIVL